MPRIAKNGTPKTFNLSHNTIERLDFLVKCGYPNRTAALEAAIQEEYNYQKMDAQRRAEKNETTA